MALTTNSVYLVGTTRFVKTNQAGQNDDGTPRTVTSWSLQHTDKRGKKSFFQCEMWNATEEQLALVEADDYILVRGNLKVSQFTDKNDIKRTTYRVNTFQVSLETDSADNGGSEQDVAPVAAPGVPRVEATDNAFGGSDPFGGDQDPFA